ncbi:hypothetical protein [Halobacillus sp. KGW1]|uniref:hypothetical protein n=1 Tax=Halobacillus sp. KGW1 TaxID=1793726 RepID=UPI0013731B5D|nr:hypothetical protein [Halobacillus sp. KGW1]
MMALAYVLIGTFFCFFQREPVHSGKEEQTVYMFYMLAWLIFWPFLLIWKLFKGK